MSYQQNPNQQFASPYNNAYVYGGQQAPQIQWSNPLDSEGEKILKSNAPEFNLLEVSREDSLRAGCTHRDPARRELTLQQTGESSYRCLKCGAEFNIVELSEEEIERWTNSMVDILQTVKTMYLDLPPQSVLGYFQMLPFLEKLPRLYKIAVDTFHKANAGASIQNGYVSGNPWNNIQQAITGPMYNGVPGYGMAPQQQPYDPYMNQPQMTAPVPQQNAGNVFMTGTPVNGYYPQQAPQGYYPQQQGQPVYQQPQAAPQNNVMVPQQGQPQQQQNTQAPQATGEENKVTTNKTFDV